jgi:hypothetical protein
MNMAAGNGIAHALNPLRGGESMTLLRALVSLVLFSAAAGALSQQQFYRNREFGFRLPIPPGTLACIPPIYQGNGHDHGPQILLSPADASFCSKSSGKRYMDIFASYTATDDEKTLHGNLQILCDSDGKSACTAAPPGLEIKGLKTEAGRLDRPGGLVEIIVVTMAGEPDPDFDPLVPSFDYWFSLTTDTQHLEDDLKVFRLMLQTIKIAPPGIRKVGQPGTH